MRTRALGARLCSPTAARRLYYICSKRFNDHDCEQEYVRADLLKSAITEDIKAMFRDEQFMAETPNPRKKELLRRLVKEVVVHDRRTIEIWYGLPNCGGVEHWNKWLPN